LPLHASSLRNLNSTPLPPLRNCACAPNLLSYLAEKGELILGGHFPFKNGLADDGNHTGIVGGQLQKIATKLNRARWGQGAQNFL
jgi:hypothetical protein